MYSAGPSTPSNKETTPVNLRDGTLYLHACVDWSLAVRSRRSPGIAKGPMRFRNQVAKFRNSGNTSVVLESAERPDLVVSCNHAQRQVDKATTYPKSAARHFRPTTGNRA